MQKNHEKIFFLHNDISTDYLKYIYLLTEEEFPGKYVNPSMANAKLWLSKFKMIIHLCCN